MDEGGWSQSIQSSTSLRLLQDMTGLVLLWWVGEIPSSYKKQDGFCLDYLAHHGFGSWQSLFLLMSRSWCEVFGKMQVLEVLPSPHVAICNAKAPFSSTVWSACVVHILWAWFRLPQMTVMLVGPLSGFKGLSLLKAQSWSHTAALPLRSHKEQSCPVV